MPEEEVGKYGLLKLGENDVIIKKGVLKFPSTPDERPMLGGTKCKSCGDISFSPRHFCPMCGDISEEFHFGTFGEVLTYTIVHQGGFGIKVPYIVGTVYFPELNDDEVAVVCQIAECPVDEIKIGMKVELIIDRVRTTFVGGMMKMIGMDAEYVVGFKYRPIKEGNA